MSGADPSPPLLLGVDGGGTSTEASLADAGGRVLGRGVAGASNPKAIGLEPALRALEAATLAAFAAADRSRTAVRVACLGLAGFAQPEDRQRLAAWSAGWDLAEILLPVSDGALVLAAGTPDGSGVAVIAGTGSIAVGSDHAGRTARSGGWGPLFGDEGSAYIVVLAALRRCARRADGREGRLGASDPLTARFLEALGVAEPSQMISAIYAPGMDRTRIAALAPLVLDAAAEDPTITADLLEPAGCDLAAMAGAVARALDWPAASLPIALAGGFLLRAEPVRRSLVGHLARQGYAPRPTLVINPVDGAVVLARRYLETNAPAD